MGSNVGNLALGGFSVPSKASMPVFIAISMSIYCGCIITVISP